MIMLSSGPLLFLEYNVHASALCIMQHDAEGTLSAQHVAQG